MEDLAVITDNFFRNICPGFFHGHYVQPLIHALKFIYRSLVQVRWTEHIFCEQYFHFKKQEQFS